VQDDEAVELGVPAGQTLGDADPVGRAHVRRVQQGVERVELDLGQAGAAELGSSASWSRR
jgi:hypothetical protein